MKCICSICGKEFERKPALVKRAKNPTCSNECRKILNHRIHFDESIPDDVRQTDRNLLPQNRVFVKSVMERDNYTCQICDKHGGSMEVHHLNGFNWDIENRFNPDNGVTLCENCHRGFHKQFGMGNNTIEQFNEYANQNRRL